MRFAGKVRYFRPETKSGLAVMDIPKEVAAHLGGLKQMRVRGTIKSLEFVSNTMPAGGGVLALSLSRKLLEDAGLKVGSRADVAWSGSKGAGMKCGLQPARSAGCPPGRARPLLA